MVIPTDCQLCIKIFSQNKVNHEANKYIIYFGSSTCKFTKHFFKNTNLNVLLLFNSVLCLHLLHQYYMFQNILIIFTDATSLSDLICLKMELAFQSAYYCITQVTVSHLNL